MSLAIKFGDSSNQNSLSGAIYFDVVTQYSKDHGGKVTEHPVEAGASITDHFVSRNSRYSISGVISHVDFSNIPSLVRLDGEVVMNNSSPPNAVTINNQASGLSRFIPGVVQQFLSRVHPEVIADSGPRQNYKMSFENFFEVLLSGLFYNEERKRWENRMTTSILFEMDGVTPVKPIPDLVVTSAQIREDENSGDDLFIDLTLEKVNFVTLERTVAPERRSATSIGTEEKKNKGNQTATVNNPTNAPRDRATVVGILSGEQ